jgi:fructose-specific component phosphotransferase system IIB-like protein
MLIATSIILAFLLGSAVAFFLGFVVGWGAKQQALQIVERAERAIEEDNAQPIIKEKADA